MLEYDPNDYTKRTIVQRKCLRLTNIPFTEELAKCFKVQQQQEQRYCLNETKKACNTTKCAQDRNRQQSPVQMQPIEQMKQSQLQQQLQPFKRQKSEQKTSPLAYSGISPNFFHFSSTKQPLPLQQQPQEQLQQLELVKHEQKQQQENPLSYNQNHLNVIQNLDELIANSKKNAPSRSMSAPPLPPPPLPESAPPQPPPSYNENTVRKCCCGGGGGGDGDVEDGDVENGDDCHKIPRFKMSGQFFDSLKKIEKNFCLTEDELCNVQENLWKLSQNSKTPIINHNIEYMLEKKLLNDHTVTFLQSILCAMVSQSKLSRHFVRQFLHALRSAVDLVNNYFHPWALLSTNDPYELAQLNGVLSMNLKEIYESPNKWLYIKNFLVMLCRNKSTEGIVDYFLKRISKEVLFPDAIDILEKIINEKSLNLSNAELCNLQNALNECTKRLFRADPILNKEYALKATKAPAVKDFDTAYRFTKVLSILSLKQINNYLHLDDIKKIVTGEKLKKIFDYVNMSVHDLNINRLSNIIEIAKEADTHRYKLNNKDLKIAITNLHSSDEQRKLQGLHDLTKYFCDMPSPYLENMLNDLRKYKLLACQQFNDIYKYMEKDRGINKDQKTLANIQRVKIALKDILQACQPLKDSNINEKTTNELADILQTVHPQDAANFVKDLDFSQLDTPEDYRKLILKLSYMQPNDLKVFSENLKTKKILPNSKIVTLQNLIDNDQKALRLTGTKAKELKKLLQNFIVKRYSRKVKRVAYTDDVTEIKDTTKKLFPEQDNEQLLKNLHETAQASTIKKMEVEKETEVEKKTIKSRKKRSRPGKRFRVKDSVEEGIVPQESDKKKHNQMQIHDKKKEKISTGKKPEKKEHEILGDSKVFKENDMNILEHDEHKKKVSKIAHLKFTDLPTNEQRDSQTPMYRDRKSRLSILFYRDMHSLKTPRELKEKPERLTQEELDAVESFDTLDKRKQQRGLSYLERASSFTEDHNRETIAWPLYEDNLSITNDTKYLDGLKKESRGLGIASFNTTFKFPDKGHEGRRQFIQKRSAHSLFKDLPYLKAVIQMRKSLTRLNRKLPKSTLVPKRLNQKLSLSVSQSESEIDPAPSLAIFPSTSLPILPSTYSEKFSPPNGKQVRKYASDMSISPSVQQLSRKLPLVTSIFKLPFQSEDDYLALISKLSYLDKRSSRAYIMDLYRKGVLNEAKLRRLQDVLRDNEFDTLPKAIRNSITKTVDDLLEDETFNLLLSELKIEYLAPIYFENYAEYKFRQPTPQCHPKIDINYNRGLANFIKLVRRTIINFRQAEVTDINKALGMSKIPVIYQNENIFDKQMLCPHNKIVGKVQKIYRVEKPVRLKDVSHLRKIGQCDCPICDNSNKLLCECPWKKEKFFHNNTNTNNNTNKLQQQYGVASGGRGTIASTRRLPGINDEKTKNESIFRFHTMPPPDDYDEYPLKEMQHSGPMTNLLYNNTTLGGCRSTLMKKFRQGYRKSYNYLAGRIKSNESFNWIMKPITDFRISTVDIIGLQTNYLTQTPNKFLNMGKQNHLQQTISGTYKQPIDKSSGSSGLQQQQQKQHQQQKHYGSSNYKKSNRKNRMNYNSKNSSIEDDSDIQNVGNSFDHELMPAIMSNHVNKMYDLIKSSITNSRYLRSIANKYPPNMLPDRSEQEATVSGTIPIETIKARTTHTYHHQSHQYKQHEKQQQQRSQQQHQRPSQQCQSHQQPSQRIFVEPCTTIEVYDNKIDLGQIQYKAPLSSSTKQRCTVITNINSKSKTSEKEGIIAVNNDNDKIKLSCAKATNLSGDNFDVNDDFNCDVSIPSIIAVPDDALVKMEIQKNSFQSFNSSIISSHNSKNQLNRNTFIANSCNVKEVMSSSAGTNMKSNQIVTVTSHTKRADPNSIKNETTNNNSTNSKKIDGNGTMHKNINVKKSKDKNSKVSMKKRRVKK